MGFTFHLLPARLEAVPVDTLAERASALLRGYVTDLPVERLVDLSEALATRARQALRSCQPRIMFAAVGPPAERLGPEGTDALEFHVEPGGGGGLVRRLPSGDTGMRRAIEVAKSAAVERGQAAGLERRLASGAGYCVERLRGQPPLAALAHGLVAAALASETDALVVSVDDAWDEALWPCDGAQLARAFMRPEQTASEGHRRRAEEMLREVVPALSPFDEPFVCQLIEELLSRLVAEVNAVRGDARAELSALDRGLDRLDTARLLAGAPLRERELLLGPAGAPEPRGRPRSAFARLHPAPDEYERWLAHLGEHLA
jgi:hypothetical protein